MTRADTIVPAESDLLCEACGYTLNGLPESGNCPECGTPISNSLGSDRVVPEWEVRPSASGFARATFQVIFSPTRFFRTLATRRDVRRALAFAKWQWIISALLIGLAGGVHATWYSRNYGTGELQIIPDAILVILLIVLTYFTLRWTTEIAARLTHWEATYRGLRMPLNVVRRGLYYHAAHYLPVGLVAAITVIGYCLLVKSQVLGAGSAIYYLYVLCAEVILSAGYLFHTYWIGMKNMMYANR